VSLLRTQMLIFGVCLYVPAGASYDFILDKAMLDALLTVGTDSAPGWRDVILTSASETTSTAGLSTDVQLFSKEKVKFVELFESQAPTSQLGSLDIAIRWALLFVNLAPLLYCSNRRSLFADLLIAAIANNLDALQAEDVSALFPDKHNMFSVTIVLFTPSILI